MQASTRLARQIGWILEGEAWHGPSWREILTEVGAAKAAARPLAHAHTIAEIVGHTATWNDVVRRRLEGETPSVSDEENWPGPANLGRDVWGSLTTELFASGERLRAAVAAFPPERLTASRPSPATGTWEDLILGQLQHLAYHAGQVALLAKADSAAIEAPAAQP